MSPEEARSQLDACTLRPGDADAEARALAASHAELKAWLERRTAEDERLAASFTEPPLPEDLRDRLIAALQTQALGHPPLGVPPSAAVKKKTACRIALPWLTLAAAAVVTLCMLHPWSPSTTRQPWRDQALAFVASIDGGELRLDKFSGNLEEIKGYLPIAKAPAPGSLPQSIAHLQSLGCKVVQIAGRPASVICFRITPGKEAHLVIIDNAGLKDVPPQNKPQFGDHGAWHTAAWSDGSQSFLLATQAEEKDLKRLFGLTALLVDYFRGLA